MTDQGSVDEILEFLRKNRFSKAEEALRNELNNRSDINGFLQKLKLEEKDSNEKAAGNELRRSGSRDSEVSKELIVKEVDCGTSTNGSVIKWENGAAAEKPSKKETFVSSEMSFTFSKNPADAAPPSDAHSYKFTSGNGTLEPYRNIDDNTSTSLVDSYALEQSMHVNLADIDKKIVETGEDIVFFGNKSTSWSGNTSKGNSGSKTKETSEIDRLVENFGKHDSYKGSIPSRTEDVVDTSENWKECSVKTLFQSSRGDASTSYNLLSSSDKREEKKKADISDVRAAIKEQESEVARALFFGKSQSTFDDKNISSLGFPLVSDTRKEEFPSLPPVKLKSVDNPLSLYCEEKFERNGSGPRIINDEEALLIGSYLDVPIRQEISSSGGKKSAGGNWLSVSQGIAVDASDLVSGFATIGDGLSESVDYRNEYWDSEEYEDDDNIGYVRQPIEDETWFLAHEFDYPSDHEKGTTRGSPDHHGRDANKDEDDQSYVEEASYLSGEQYLLAKDAEPISSENDRRLTVSEIYPASKKNDLVAQYDGQLIDEELFNSMRDEPVWQGFVAQSNELVMLGDKKGINVHRKSHLDDDCLEDYQHDSVRSIGVGINCDAADFGSEVCESLAGCSSEGDFEYSRDHDAVASRFKQLYSESDIKHIDGPNKNKQKASKNDGPDYIVDNDSGASFHVKIETDGGFSFGSSQKDGQLMHAESSKSLWSGNRETVTRDKNAKRLSASTATDDMVATWRRKSSDSSSSRSSLKENNATSIKSVNSSPSTLSNYACEERKDDDRNDSSEREDDHGTALDDEEAVAVQEQKEEFETKFINGIIEIEQFAMEQQNPKTQRQWRYTWEAQSHSPNLRLFLFDSTTNQKIHCKSLDVSIILEKSQLLVTWINDNEDEEATSKENRSEEFVSLCVPVPRVLLDTESSVNFKALDDHIEVRLVLLLPVDHPLVSDFNLVTDSREKSAPLVMDYDLKTLSLMGGVNFYCRNCSNMLTKKELFDFSEMPSINWRESADNWFGTCCCSFGGISEKMVVKYTNSYTCSSGLCLLSATTVLLSKDDLVECINSDKFGTENQIESSLALSCDLGRVEPGSRSSERNAESHENGGESACGRVDDSMLGCKDKASMYGCCVHDSHDSNESFQLEQQLTLDKKFLLDGFLEDVFMAKASNVSKNVEWIKFACPECSSPLGAYPSDVGSNDKPIDGGVRLFKCYISTSSAIGESSDVFRKYTLEKMFTNQLVECAKEELSFHVLVKDLTTKSPLFQIVILNPNSWFSTGLCSSRDVLVSTLELSPIVKVLFSNCNSTVVKKIDEEVYLLKEQGEELIDLITNASKFLPSSYSYLQGSLVSSMHR